MFALHKTTITDSPIPFLFIYYIFNHTFYFQERQKNDAKIKEEKKKVQKEKKPGFDGRWYTDINEGYFHFKIFT